MYFPLDAAACSFGAGVTWLQPSSLSTNLLASRSPAPAALGTQHLDWMGAGAGCWALSHSHHHPREPGMGWLHLRDLQPLRHEQNDGCSSKQGIARWVLRKESQAEQDGHEHLVKVMKMKAARHRCSAGFLSLCLPPLLLLCWGNQACSIVSACFRGLLGSTSLLGGSWAGVSSDTSRKSLYNYWYSQLCLPQNLG